MKKSIIGLLLCASISTISTLHSCSSLNKNSISENEKETANKFDVGEYLNQGDKLISFGINYMLDEKRGEPYLVSRQIRTFQSNGKFRDLEIIFKVDGSFGEIDNNPIIYHEILSSENLSINGTNFEIEEVTKYDCGIKKLNSELQLPLIEDYKPDGDYDLIVTKSKIFFWDNGKNEERNYRKGKIQLKSKKKI